MSEKINGLKTSCEIFVLTIVSLLMFVPSHSGQHSEVASADHCQKVLHEPRKKNAGHYVSLNRFDDRDVISRLAIPGVTGIQRRYHWKSLEPSLGTYDLSEIEADLAEASKHGLQLVVFVEDKTFNGELPTPKYLQKDFTVANRNGGYTTIRWNPYVIERFTALIGEIGARFDCHANFEGLAIQESALSLNSPALTENQYSPEAYRDALIVVLQSASNALPTSRVFWYMNFLPGRQKYLEEIALAVTDSGVVVGGPDILPDNSALQARTYPLYDKLHTRITLFNSMQNDSYAHENRQSDNGEKYWSMEELYLYGVDRLHIEYLFWNRKSWRKPGDSHDWSDARKVISKHRDFGQE